jgi:hypothetical protein
MEGLVNNIAEPRWVFHKVIMLGAMARDADSIGFLKRITADQARRHLSGDDDHRDRIHQCIGDACNDIGRAGAAGDEDNAGLSRRACIAFGSMRRTRFGTNEDMFDALLLEQRVIDGEHCTAGIAEHDFHAEIDKRLDEDFGSGQFGGHDVLLLQCGINDKAAAVMDNKLWCQGLIV